MKLLTSQKDMVYDLLDKAELSPAQFELIEVESRKWRGILATELRYLNSDYYFSFETGPGTDTSHYAIFCPGEMAHTESEYPGDWVGQLRCLNKWLKNLIREIKAPNKWHRLKNEIEGIKIKFDHDEDKFSVSEYEDLKRRIFLLKQGVTTLGLSQGQANIINEKLDHITELAKEMNKFDWKSLFLGTIASVVIQIGVTPHNAQTLWTLIKNIFSNYILP